MLKSDEQKIAKLIKKNAAKAAAKEARPRKEYDPTLLKSEDVDPELRNFFSEMKKREF